MLCIMVVPFSNPATSTESRDVAKEKKINPSPMTILCLR